MPTLKLTDTHKQNLLNLVKYFANSYPRDSINSRLEQIDKAYNMETYQEVKADARVNKKEDAEFSDRFTEVDVPLVRKQVQSEIPFMENIFLTDNPIFSVDKSKLSGEMELAASGINSKISQDSQIARWELEISDFLLKCAKYNLGALEVSWKSKSFFRKRFSASSTNLQTTTVEWQGNAIKSIDPYNIFFDTNVNPWELASKGEFVGYVEKVSHTLLAEQVSELILLNKSGETQMFLDYSPELWTKSSAVSPNDFPFKSPEIIPANVAQPAGWATFSSEAGLQVDSKSTDKYGKSGTYYERMTVYVRFIPISVGLTVSEKEEDNFTPQIWKLIFIGGQHLLAAIPANNSHNLLPIALARPDYDNLGIQGKSSIECVVSMQKLAGEFMQRRIASIDRNIGDMAIIDGRYIDREVFEKRIPDRKVFTNSKFASSNKSINDIYRPIGFNDATGNLLHVELPFIMELAASTNLSNASRYGSFQKGNKTPDEVRQTMANSEAPLLRRALQLELQAFYYVKIMLQHNYVDYAQLESIAQPDGTVIEFDPHTLLSAVIKFKLAGGLDPLAVAMRQGELAAVFEMAQTIPIINQRYDLFKLFEDTFYARGLELAKYAVSPEQQAAEASAGNPEQQPAPAAPDANSI